MADHPGFPRPRPFDDSPLGRALARLERFRRFPRCATPEALDALFARWAARLAQWDRRTKGKGHVGPPAPDAPSGVDTRPSLLRLYEDRAASGRSIRHPRDTVRRRWVIVQGKVVRLRRPTIAEVWMSPDATAHDALSAWRASHGLPCPPPAARRPAPAGPGEADQPRPP